MLRGRPAGATGLPNPPPPSEPADVARTIEAPDGGAESLVKIRRRPLRGNVGMNNRGDRSASKYELYLRLRVEGSLAVPRLLEVAPHNRMAKFCHESLH
jgi:hypothetical protein